MKNVSSTKRRDFLKQITIGTGALAWGLNGCNTNNAEEKRNAFPLKQNQTFNMCGYMAPPLDTVRIGLIGVGNRGSGAVRRLLQIENAEIKAIADKLEARVKRSNENILSRGMPEAAEYYGSEDKWKELCERDDIDLVYICTPWSWHTPMALYAMEQGKHVAVEVPAAKTLEEAWQLVETSERTRKHCMMLENCCYDFFEMLTFVDDASIKGAFVTVARVKIDGKEVESFQKQTIDLTAYQSGNAKLLVSEEINAGTYKQLSIVLDYASDDSGNEPGCYVLDTDESTLSVKLSPV